MKTSESETIATQFNRKFDIFGLQNRFIGSLVSRPLVKVNEDSG